MRRPHTGSPSAATGRIRLRQTHG